jgi:hypothetical protein
LSHKRYCPFFSSAGYTFRMKFFRFIDLALGIAEHMRHPGGMFLKD